MASSLENTRSEFTALARPGTPVGPYVVLGPLASGGMAAVHLGRLEGANGFSRLVAIKQMLPAMGRDREARAMLADEARIASRVIHPNVVKTLDVVTESDELFLVLEYVDGETLARLIKACARRKERVPIPVAVAVMVGALRGTHAAHQATDETGQLLDVVHRDLSPQNIMVDLTGVA